MADVCFRVDVLGRQLCSGSSRLWPTRSYEVIDFLTAAMVLLLLLFRGSGHKDERKAWVNEKGLSTFLLMVKALVVKSENSLTLCWRLRTCGVSSRWFEGPPLTIHGCFRTDVAYSL